MQFLIIHSVSSLNLTNEYLNHKCVINQGKYNSGSKYEDNLNYAFHLCRGDSYGSKCRTCIDIAVAGVMSHHTFKYRIKFLQCCKTLSLCKKRKDYMNQNSD
ncbi:hypothetical protein DY000_02029718 [Brassica cretica]|uniref:Gnk2-homologous domain-containing protein n=1 Tax=Brassica cretica TaxID=69181 RepID=A0ABQ7DC09_BRACR|nr:hypothetical protein DY000_02029718 [Brassica cretica]